MTGRKGAGMRKKIKDFLENVWNSITYGLKDLCGRPSPMKRFIAVLIVGGVLAIVSIYTLVSSIYSIGHDAKKEFIELQHLKNVNYEYEQ